MKAKKNLIISQAFLVIVMLGVIIFVINYLKEDIWDKNEHLLKKAITANTKTGDNIELSKLTSFDWDTMYSFTPYTPKEKVYETVGYKWDNISETVSEGMDQIVFMKDNKVVCYIYGYAKSKEYGFLFAYDSQEFVKTLYAKDNPIFNVKRTNGVTFLNYKAPYNKLSFKIVDINTGKEIDEARFIVTDTEKEFNINKENKEFTLASKAVKDKSIYPYGYTTITVSKGYYTRIDHNLPIGSGGGQVLIELTPIEQGANQAYDEKFHYGSMSGIADFLDYYKADTFQYTRESN